ncbi:MAG: hypothetical protein LAP87_07775 [Acidobacteriia bacterium]|nr:hypothetical protein [Terriglobia bacterium]
MKGKILGAVILALIAMPAFGQVRGRFDARAAVNMDAVARDAASRPPAARARMEVHKPQRVTRPANRVAATVTSHAAESPSATAASVTPNVSGFQGLADNFTAIPPDTDGAVSPQYVVTMLNTQVLIQDRSGATRENYPIDLNSFWSALGTFTDTFDPRIYYDAASQRWIASAAVNGQSQASALLVGVSRTDDPGGNWDQFMINVNATGTPSTSAVWGDYPVLGFNGNWVVVSLNLFQVRGRGDYQSTNLYVFDKSALYQGGQDPFKVFPDDQGEFIPARDFDGLPNTLYLVQAFAGDVGFADGAGTIRISKITGAVGAESFSGGNGGTITINDPWSDSGPTDSTGAPLDFAPQLGTTARIDTGDSRLQNCVLRGGTIWCSHTIFLPLTGPTRAAVQWFQMNPATAGILQRGRIDDSSSTNFYAYPSIAVNKNNDVLIGYNRFSANDYPSAEFSFRLASDAPNTLEPEVMVKAGEAPYVVTGRQSGSNRWGDYSTTMVDPADDLTFWTIQEYAAAPPQGRNGRFGTWWAAVTAPSAGISLPQPLFPSQGILNAASFTGGGVAPGEVITIFGSNLGPIVLQQPTVSASGVVGRIAGGTSVLFDGVAAPMIGALAGQVSAVVPFAVQGKASTQVQVSFLGTVSNPITIPVVGTAPGIFTLNEQGKGPGAILNQDSTVNSAANPAARGSTIQIFATGGGVIPGVTEGTLAPRLSASQIAATARVGGLPAPVIYAGVAPGLIVGALQVNVTIPQGVTPGSAVSVDITIGGVTSAAGVTVAVR